MSLIDDIRKDREAGTPGPWGNGKTGEEQRLILGDGGAGKYVCTVKIHQIPRVMGMLEETIRDTNARRIARVPDMEAVLLAAEEAMFQYETLIKDVVRLNEFDLSEDYEAIAAYRKATRESHE